MTPGLDGRSSCQFAAGLDTGPAASCRAGCWSGCWLPGRMPVSRFVRSSLFAHFRSRSLLSLAPRFFARYRSFCPDAAVAPQVALVGQPLRARPRAGHLDRPCYDGKYFGYCLVSYLSRNSEDFIIRVSYIKKIKRLFQNFTIHLL